MIQDDGPLVTVRLSGWDQIATDESGESVGDGPVLGLPRVEIFLFSRADSSSGDKDSGGAHRRLPS
jgi:hypothetical protein